MLKTLLRSAAIALTLTPCAIAGEEGTLTLFRWNLGFRAETEPVLEKKIHEAQLEAFLNGAQLAGHESLFRGCYLAHFRRPQGRRLASAGKPTAYRVCVPAKAP